MTKMEESLKVFAALIKDYTYDITILANASAFLYEQLENINWVGFYMVKNQELLLGPFQGKVACTTIPFSKGVCGTCAAQQKTILVPNVHEFRGHIACDSASKSEICIPILVHDKLYAILDIDSPILNRFNDSDQQYLKSIGEIIANELEKIIK